MPIIHHIKDTPRGFIAGAFILFVTARLGETDVIQTMEEANEKLPETPFVLSMHGMQVFVLPRSEIETVKSLPECEVSIKKHHFNVFLGEYTFMGTKADEFDDTMRYTLTRSTPTALDAFTDEIGYAMDQCIGQCDDVWTGIRIRAAMARIASLLSGRVFVGLPLSRDPEWVEATTQYTQNVTTAWMILRLIPRFIRPLVATFLPQVRTLKRFRRATVEKLSPILAAKRQGIHSKTTSDPAGGSMLEWLTAHYKVQPTAEQLARDELLVTFASIYNLTNAISSMVFDLAKYPEHIPELRQELAEVLGLSGIIDKHALSRLRKCDSFIRESQRLSPPSLANIPRIVTNPHGFVTSTGHRIPAGSTVMIRAHPINRDRKLWGDNADQFDGFRFSKLRDMPGNALKYQHTSTGTDNINFGHGIWACPGRFFASAQLKVILAELLRRYDIMRSPQTPNPGQLHYGLAVVPDPEAEVLFRKRML
ncbi:unnamed protein product [Zymoseptoria tritici ST99CH_1A5]|uniref:Cytochrome P450 monooxygenase n=1 Tax=Zymoseptoria tritici ST99CH_1A5 TaxID=1276529 RepID=A0A1Y6L8L1_ZYMTR|nr:unnamed protein product [Zymoseptoria tritici ST99CH_1A5]